MTSFELLRRYFRRQVYLQREEENLKTYEEIKEGIYFKGPNLWILSCTMIIACIGLNTNSVSAIIGAMLISPLMGPIIGLGFGMAINDNFLKRESFKNWIMMMLISVVSAVIYFLITPFDDNTELLASFQKATIFDILLAFFGGMAGFIGIMKKEGTKILAGVAVATACMPPLCTCAYGIAHLDYSYTLGGFYFYIINCLFIGLATFILARYFGYHQSTQLSLLKSTTKWLWYMFIVLMLVPGIYIAYDRWHEQKNLQTLPTDKQRIEQLEKKINDLENLIKNKNS